MEKETSKKKKLRRSSIDKADIFKERRISNKGNFTWTKRGNVFVYESDRKINQYMTNDLYKGIHIVSMVKAELKKGISSGAITVPKMEKRNIKGKMVFFDKDNVLKNKGKEIVAIDIRRCYWSTLFESGYISKSLYDRGLSKDEYKLACNLSVGSLGMKETTEVYENGVVVNSYVKQSEFSGIRLHIISKVHKIAMSIINSSSETKEGFLWYLTDCFFVLKEYEEVFKEAINKAGYETKSEYHDKYIVDTTFKRSGTFKYFLKWDAFDEDSLLNKSYNFSSKNDINNKKEQI